MMRSDEGGREKQREEKRERKKGRGGDQMRRYFEEVRSWWDGKSI